MKKRIERIVRKAVGRSIPCDVSLPEQSGFGHYATNMALRLAKRKRKPPLALAEELAEKIKKHAPTGFFEDVRAVEPGFINFWLTKGVLQKELHSIAKQNKAYGRSTVGKRRAVIVEYSDPNIAKRMHVGHLRATIIGDALANIYDALGYRVIRWNYLGDWGTQFGKLIVAYRLWGKKSKVEKNPIEALHALYVRFHEEAKQNPELERQGQEEFRKLEAGDKENRKLWAWFKQESLKEFDAMYRTLGVRFDTMVSESFYEKNVRALVTNVLRRGIARPSEGAVIIPLTTFNLPPALIQKSDEASLYLTRDIANVEYRLRKYKPAKILYVVGNEQSLHFQQLFAVAKILNLTASELVHVKYGLVLGESGHKLATREGQTVPLREVIAKAVHLARTVVEKKNPKLSEKEKTRIAETVAIGALKYNDLRENRHSDIVFNWGRMLDFSGDSAPYLQYTYSRLMSIVKKAGRIRRPDASFLEEEIELSLIRKVIDFPDVILLCAEALLTNPLASHLYGLAALANKFYETTPVLKDDDQSRRNARLLLITTVAQTLQNGLALLGIRTLQKI